MAEQLHALATAAIDISDGFIQDLSHICRASNVGARVDLQRLPMSDDFKEASRRLEKDPLHFALHGGEDYQLLFCSKDSNLDLPQVHSGWFYREGSRCSTCRQKRRNCRR